MSYQIESPALVLFGRGEAAKAPHHARKFGTRGLIVHGQSEERAAFIMRALADLSLAKIACDGEPTLEDLTGSLEFARPHRPDWVLAIGGGAALDLGKALAALIPAPGDPMDHLEVVGKGLPLVAQPLPFIALPTTAGTGAEVTKNAVIGLGDHGRKVSLRGSAMLADVAIIDPALTDGCPRRVTLASGLDALTQVIEPYVSSKATPFTDAITRPAIAQALPALMRLMTEECPKARDQMAHVSLMGGLALANSGLGAVHGLAGVLGGQLGAPHGAICGALLGPVLRANINALAHSPEGSRSKARLTEVCEILAQPLGCASDAVPEALAAWAHGAGLPRLESYGMTRAMCPPVAAASADTSSMRGNPTVLAQAALETALETAL